MNKNKLAKQIFIKYLNRKLNPSKNIFNKIKRTVGIFGMA